MRDDLIPGLLASETRNRHASEIAAQDEFNRANPPIKDLAAPRVLRKTELPTKQWRNLERHPAQLRKDQGSDLPPATIASGTVHGGHPAPASVLDPDNR